MRPLYGYPTSFGNKRVCVLPHAGPASYTRIQLGSPSGAPVSGGDTFEAVEAGMKTLDIVFGGITDSGLYRVESIPLSASDPTTGAAIPGTTYALMWRVVATGAEVADSANLSGETVRLTAYGPN